MINKYDAGLSIFANVVDNGIVKFMTQLRKDFNDNVRSEMAEINTFLTVDESSIPGFKIGIVAICKNPDRNTTDCELAMVFDNKADGSSLSVELSTLKGHRDQAGFSDTLDIFNTRKWLEFVTGPLAAYRITADNSIKLKGTATIPKTIS